MFPWAPVPSATVATTTRIRLDLRPRALRVGDATAAAYHWIRRLRSENFGDRNLLYCFVPEQPTEHKMKKAFTLIELLTVVAILGILAGLLFPVFERTKVAGKKASCAQNLHSLHLATTLYQGDSDDIYPFAMEPYWHNMVCSMDWEWMREVEGCKAPDPIMILAPYLQSREVWHCPLDSGFDVLDFEQEVNQQVPTSYSATGASYDYNSDLGLLRLRSTNLFDGVKAVIYHDRAGAWHGSGERNRIVPYNATMRDLYAGYRYQAVHADGHIRTLRARELNFGLGAGWYDGRAKRGYQTYL
ncbi:MAG: hypothetical protein C4320_00135 [Armatimonadota bacterium]